ncbi:MAG: hypothetical protein ACRC2Y_05015 [Aeromonas veronii]
MSTPILSDADFIISDVSVTHEIPTFSTTAINGVTTTKGRGLHFIKASATVTLVGVEDIKRFSALMLNIKGRLNPFRLSLQDSSDGKGGCNPLYTNASPILSNDIGIGAVSMVLGGFSGVIPAGSFFQFPNDSKIHCLTADAKPNQEARFFPAARVPATAKSRLNFSPVPLMRLEADSFDVSFERAKSVTLKMVEVL